MSSGHSAAAMIVLQIRSAGVQVQLDVLSSTAGLPSEPVIALNSLAPWRVEVCAVALSLALVFVS
jgi:hypothetical protein